MSQGGSGAGHLVGVSRQRERHVSRPWGGTVLGCQRDHKKVDVADTEDGTGGWGA